MKIQSFSKLLFATLLVTSLSIFFQRNLNSENSGSNSIQETEGYSTIFHTASSGVKKDSPSGGRDKALGGTVRDKSPGRDRYSRDNGSSGDKHSN